MLCVTSTLVNALSFVYVFLTCRSNDETDAGGGSAGWISSVSIDFCIQAYFYTV